MDETLQSGQVMLAAHQLRLDAVEANLREQRDGVRAVHKRIDSILLVLIGNLLVSVFGLVAVLARGGV